MNVPQIVRFWEVKGVGLENEVLDDVASCCFFTSFSKGFLFSDYSLWTF